MLASLHAATSRPRSSALPGCARAPRATLEEDAGADVSGAEVPDSDPLPSNEALEADVARERREAEDLLAAFDRPARGAARSVPSGGPGFVEYYAGDPGARTAAPAPRAHRRPVPAPRQADLATVVKPQRRRPSIPPWLFWAGASASMLGLGFVVAVLTTRDPASAPPSQSSPAVSGPPRASIQAPATARDDVPAPDPAPRAGPPSTAASTLPARSSAPRAPDEGNAAPRPPIRPGPATPPASTSRPAEDGPIRRL